MSAYHAGRKSSVAKKPYNPIIGEVFQCHWDIPSNNLNLKMINQIKSHSINAGDKDDELSLDGPIPWCRKDQLTFVAEQVSHHPPSNSENISVSHFKIFDHF